MSPMPQPRSGKTAPPSTVYTAILAVAFAVVLATFGYVVYVCNIRYDTFF